MKLLRGLRKYSEEKCRAPAAWEILRLVFLKKLDAKLEYRVLLFWECVGGGEGEGGRICGSQVDSRKVLRG